jgi:Leucine-rich repeat (LRR) protein
MQLGRPQFLRRNLFTLAIAVLALFGLGRLAGWAQGRWAVVRSQREVRALVEELGGHAYFDYQLIDPDRATLADDDGRSCHPSWIGQRLGRDWIHDLFYVTFAQFRTHQQDRYTPTRREEIDDGSIEKLASLVGLKWLALSGTAVTDQGVQRIAGLPKLERIWLSQTKITDRSLSALASAKNLTHLAIEATPTSDQGLQSVAQLPRLQFLSLGSPYITSRGLRLLEKSTALEELMLDRSNVDTEAMRSLGKLGRLRKLSLRAAPVTDDGLAQLPGLTGLTELHLDGTRITDRGLSVASHWSQLGELSVSHTAVSDAGLRALAPCTKLERLRIQGTACTLAGVWDLFVELQGRSPLEAFQATFPTSSVSGNLTSLDLTGTRVSDADIARLESFQSLEWLFIPDSPLTDLGAKQLAELELRNLTLLNINGSRVTDQGLQALAGIRSLRNLHVAKTRITSAAASEIQKAHPSLRVYVHEVVINRS